MKSMKIADQRLQMGPFAEPADAEMDDTCRSSEMRSRFDQVERRGLAREMRA